MTHNFSERIPVELISGRLRGGNSELEERLLNQWLLKEENRKTYEKVERIWAEVCRRTSGAEFDEKAAWEEVESRIREAYWKDATLKVRRSLYAVSCIAAVLIIGLTTTVFLLSGRKSNPEISNEFVSIASASSKTRVSLPDGTKTVIYPESELAYGSDFNVDSRDIELTGRAYFDVARNPEKPFNINVNGLTVTAVGTSFDLDARSNQVTVSLAEGIVRLSPKNNDEEVMMKAGQIATFDKTTGAIEITEGDPSRFCLWTGNSIKFSDATLGTVCRDLSDWYDMNIMVPDSLKNEGSLTFTITTEPVEVVLSIISRTNSLNYRNEGNNTVIIF